MFAPQSVEGAARNPAQLSALSPRGPRSSPCGIGGNDIGFTEVIQNCVTYTRSARRAVIATCATGVDESSAPDRRHGAPGRRCARRDGRQRSPSARVFVVGYPTILPDRGSGCWPSLPILGPTSPTYGRRPRSSTPCCAPQATAAGVGFVDTYVPSEGRSACASSGTRCGPAARALQPGVRRCTPTPRGMAGIAALVGTAAA